MKQRKSNKYKQLWVSPEFARKFKAEAALNGCKLFDYSQQLAQSQDNVKDVFKEGDKSLKKGWRIDL